MVLRVDEYKNEYTWSRLMRLTDTKKRYGSYSPIEEIVSFNKMNRHWGFYLDWYRHSLASVLTPLG
jgi:hypothetical protein